MFKEDMINAEEVYQTFKKKKKAKFNEKEHCLMVIRVMADPDKGTMSAFCKEAGIGDTTFYRWIAESEIFNECYRFGCMISRENWEEQGREGLLNGDFNIEVWKTQGASRYGVGKTNRVRVHIDADTTPFDQYKQLLSQASLGDFSASELKQLMESINIGCRAYEQFEMQKEIDKMREDLRLMGERSGDNIRSIERAKKTN